MTRKQFILFCLLFIALSYSPSFKADTPEEEALFCPFCLTNLEEPYGCQEKAKRDPCEPD